MQAMFFTVYTCFVPYCCHTEEICLTRFHGGHRIGKGKYLRVLSGECSLIQCTGARIDNAQCSMLKRKSHKGPPSDA